MTRHLRWRPILSLLLCAAGLIGMMSGLVTVRALESADHVTAGGITYRFTNSYAFTPDSYTIAGFWGTEEMVGVPDTKTGYLYYDITIDVDPSAADNGGRGIVLTIDGTNVSGMIHDQHLNTTETGAEGAAMRVYPAAGLSGTFKGVLDVSGVTGDGVFRVQGTKSTLTVNEMKYLDGVTMESAQPEPDPEPEPETFTLTGTVTGSDAVDAPVTVILYGGETELGRMDTTDGHYSFSVTPGTYTLMFSQAHHASETSAVTVTDANATVDMTLCLLGDVNGDGAINVAEYGLVLAHVREIRMLEEDRQLYADIDGDGLVTVVDYGRVLAHVREVILLY